MEYPNGDVEEQVKSLRDETSAEMDQRILNDLFGRFERIEATGATVRPPGSWRTIMRGKRTRLVIAAAIAAGIMLPVGYGAVKAVMKYVILTEEKVVFKYAEPNGGVAAYGVGRAVGTMVSGDVDEEEARARLEEFYQLYRDGKAREVKPGFWQATLSNGETFNFGGDPARAMGEFTPEEKERLQEQFEEINELRKAGKGERTFLKEIEKDGLRIRLYEVRYTLSNGEVITVGEGMPAE